MTSGEVDVSVSEPSEFTMASDYRGQRGLEQMRSTNSAAIRGLAKELEYVKFENEVLKDFIFEKGGPYGEARRNDAVGGAPPKYDKEEEGSIHDPESDQGLGGRPPRYYGFNKFYKPELATTKRYEDLQQETHKVSSEFIIHRFR